MLTINKSGLKSTTVNGVEINDFREIAKIFTENPKYESKNGEMSIYLIPDNYIIDIQNTLSQPSSGDMHSIVTEAKSKSGRDGRKIKKQHVDMMKSALEGKMPLEDLDDYISHIEKDEVKHAVRGVYKRAMGILVNSSKDLLNMRELMLEDLMYTDSEGKIHNGELVPLPITNFTKEQIDEIGPNGGKTEFYIERTGGLKKITLKGNKLFEIQQLIEEKKDYNNEKIFVSGDSDVTNSQYNPIFIEYMPTGEEMVEITYIYGPNRSGKTYYAAKYTTLWSEMFEDWPIFLFSRREKDKVLDDIKNVNRVAIDETLFTSPLTMSDFKHSLVIFDDIDTIPDKKICKAIQKLRDDIMETGRQKMIYVINTSHLGMNWAPTRTVLNEANSYTLFPRKGNYEHNFKILKDKMGMKPQAIKEIMDRPNGFAHKGVWGWVTVYKDSPQYLIFENGVKLL